MTPDAGELMALAELRLLVNEYDPGESDWYFRRGVIHGVIDRIAASQPDREAVARAIKTVWTYVGVDGIRRFNEASVENATNAILSLLSVQVDGEQKITADNERLLSCPFCGPGNSQVDTWHDDVSKRWRVGCGRCGSSSGASVHREGSKEAAIKSWNTRNGSPPVAETKPSPSSTSATATETALRAAKRLCDNINEFGHVTDAEIFDATETAIQKALETINVA